MALHLSKADTADSYSLPALQLLQCRLQELAPPETEKAEDAPAQWNAGQVPVKADQEQEREEAVLAAAAAPVEGADSAPVGRGPEEMAADPAEARTGLSLAEEHPKKKAEVLAHNIQPQAAQLLLTCFCDSNMLRAISEHLSVDFLQCHSLACLLACLMPDLLL